MDILRVVVERCIGCGKCELACAFTHADSRGPGHSRINVTRGAVETGTPIVCFQCHEAACVDACTTGALSRNGATDAIEIDQARCVGCRNCVVACPFGNIAWNEGVHRVEKCDLCGGRPQCVPFCPTRALEYLPASLAVRPARRSDGGQ